MTDEMEQRITEAAERAAKRAIDLASRDAEKATKLAVERAVRDANVDRDLQEHTLHLETINGSQKSMAADLAGLRHDFGDIIETFKEQANATAAISNFVAQQKEVGFKRWTIWIGVTAALAAYAGLIVAIITKFSSS